MLRVSWPLSPTTERYFSSNHCPGFITISNRDQIALMSYNQSITLPVNPKVNIVPNQCSSPERDQPSPRTGIREDMLVFFSLQPRVRKCRGKEWNHLHIRFFLLIGLSGAVFTICVLLIQYLSGSDKFARQQADGLGPDK